MWISIPRFASPDAPLDAEPISYGARRVTREEAARLMAADPRCRVATPGEIGLAVVLQDLADETRAEPTNRSDRTRADNPPTPARKG